MKIYVRSMRSLLFSASASKSSSLKGDTLLKVASIYNLYILHPLDMSEAFHIAGFYTLQLTFIQVVTKQNIRKLEFLIDIVS